MKQDLSAILQHQSLKENTILLGSRALRCLGVARRVVFRIRQKRLALRLEMWTVSTLRRGRFVNENRLKKARLNIVHLQRLEIDGYGSTVIRMLTQKLRSSASVKDVLWASDFLLSHVDSDAGKMVCRLWGDLGRKQVSRLGPQACASALLLCSKYGLYAPNILSRAQSHFLTNWNVAPAIWNLAKDEIDPLQSRADADSLFWNIYGASGLLTPSTKQLEDLSFSSLMKNINQQMTREPVKSTFSTPRVSIIISFFNEERNLEISLRSIQNQTFEDFEVLMMDDGSTDKSGEIALSFANNDGRFLYFRQQANLGTYACRNLALKEARGEVVTTHDADDWSHPQKIEKQLSKLDKGFIAVLGKRYRVTEDLRFVYSDGLRQLVGNDMASLMFLKSEVIKKIGEYIEVRAGADSEFFRRIYGTFGPHRVGTLDEVPPMTLQLSRAGSLTKNGPTSFVGKHFGWRHDFHKWSLQQGVRFHTDGSLRIDSGHEAAEGFSRNLRCGPLFEGRLEVDVALVADFSRKSIFLTQRSVIFEEALEASSDPIFLYHSPPPWRASIALSGLIQDYLEAGKVRLVMPGQEVSAKVVIADPLSMRYPHEGVGEIWARYVITASDAPLNLYASSFGADVDDYRPLNHFLDQEKAKLDQ